MHSLTDEGAKHAEVESELQFIAEQFYDGAGFSEATLQAAHEDADFPVPRCGLEYCLAVLTERGLVAEAIDQADGEDEGTPDEPEPTPEPESGEHLLIPV